MLDLVQSASRCDATEPPLAGRSPLNETAVQSSPRRLRQHVSTEIRPDGRRSPLPDSPPRCRPTILLAVPTWRRAAIGRPTAGPAARGTLAVAMCT